MGCSSAASTPLSAPPGEDPQTTEPVIEAEAAPTVETPSVEVQPAPVEVDLLHAVRTDLAVSSAYRNQSSQAAALIDGDLETAWNSTTGELVGASIEVRIPNDAHVSALMMTAGFTHMQRETDLFLGNHRMARIRVLRDGEEVGFFPLDVDVRTLQRIPLDAPGGVYRIEVVEVLQGTRADWRETCISELQILGTAPDATPGGRMPHLTIGPLPAPTVLTPPSREAVLRAHRQRVASIERQWTELEGYADEGREGSSPSEYWDMSANDIDRLRRAVLEQTATFVAPIDEAKADALRMLALRPLSHRWTDWQSRPLLREELVALGQAMDSVANWLNDDEARCRWSRALGHLHLLRATSMALAEREHSEIDDSEAALDERRLPHGGARIDSLMAIAEALEGAKRDWSRNTQGAAARIGRLHPPDNANLTPELTLVNAQIEVARRTCGWR